ncbi:unnamed protein product, partial [Urochloa humidicola]
MDHVLDLNVEPPMDEDLAGLDLNIPIASDLQQLHDANQHDAAELDTDFQQLHGANELNA